MPARQVLTDETIVVKGLRELQKALIDADPAVKKALNRTLKAAGNLVKKTAQGNISHRTARHGNAGPPLAETLKVSSTQTGVSLWSNAPHAGVQDQGGQVGREHATLLKRNEVSQYMTRAVRSDTPGVEAMIRGAIDEGLRGLED